MFVNFSEEVRHILKQAEKQRDWLNHPYVGSEHLMLAILKSGKLKEVFKKHKITYDIFRDKVINLFGIGRKKSNFILYTPLFKKILENSVIEAREEGKKIVTTEIILLSILDEDNSIANGVLESMNVDIDRLYYDLRLNKCKQNKKSRKTLLEEIGVNLNTLALENKLDPVIGRDREIKNIMEILLRRKKNNPILIGPAGVGKTALVEGLANIIVSDKCPKYLKNKKIIALNIYSLVSGTKYRGEFEEKMKRIIKELEYDEDIILFIDEIHTIVGAGGAEGAIDASNILKPALARGNIKIIGGTTTDEYKKYIEPDAALSRRFQIIKVEEPNKENLINILKSIKPLYEDYYNIKISNAIINDIASLSDKYLKNRYEPDKSIDILDEACAKKMVSSNKNDVRKLKILNKINELGRKKINAITNNDFALATTIKIDINKYKKELEKIKEEKKELEIEDVEETVKLKGNLKYLKLDNKNYELIKNNLNNRIIGQEDNIDKILKSFIKKNMLSKKNVYSVLISGKKHVGKTYMSKTILKEIFGSNVLELDLSLYNSPHMVSRLMGTTINYSPYDTKDSVFDKIRMNPSSGILIRNYDDACTEVRNLFKKIIREGFIEDARGIKIDFTNTIIIFIEDISNENISVGFNKSNAYEFDIKTTDKIIIDNISVTDKNKIAKKMLESIVQKYKKYNISIDDNLYNKVINSDNIADIKKEIDKVEEKIVSNILNSKNIKLMKEERLNI